MTADSTGPRIGVLNLDAMEQARLWRLLGPEKATQTLLAALRTAVLLGETIVLDRNQVLEGIFFVAVGPERLAWQLGFEPGAPLPITVALINNGDGPARLDAEGPWQTSEGRRWAVGADLARDIDLNFEAVAGDASRVSSPLVAMTGRYADAVASSEQSVNAPGFGPGWLRADATFLPQELWELRDEALARELIDRGRIAWIEAMKTGRVAVQPFRRRPLDLGAALEAAAVPSPRVRDLAVAILGVQEVDGQTRECTSRHTRWAGESGDEACGRTHVTKRSLLVRWLDGEHVAGLEPPQITDDLVESFTITDRYCAMRWWNAAYYDAIAIRDDLRLLTLFNERGEAAEQDATELSRQTTQVELDWGLRAAPPTRWETLRARTRRSTGHGARDVVVEGELVRHVAEMPPSQFAQLRRYESVDYAKLWADPDSKTMFDLALAARDLAGDHVPRSTRLKIQSLRFVALALLATIFSLRDAGLLPVQGLLWISVWVSIALVAAFPYAEVAALTKLSSGRLQSVVRVRGDR